MSEFVKKLYAWCLNKVRFVAGAIRAFLPHVLPSKKKTIAFLKRVFLILAMMLLMCPVIVRVGGSMSTGLPVFETTATYTMIGDGNKDWRLIFTSSGTVTFSKTITVDLFLVGGGGSGANGSYSTGGGGGYTKTYNSIVLVKDIAYPIVVGSGGTAVTSGNGHTGGKSWCILETSYYSNGGYGGNYNSSTSPGGNGGSGGGSYNYAGGSNGSNGGGTYGGYGQGTTTREFGESTGTLYAYGGAGNHGTLTPLIANSGNGGNATDSSGTAGSSGICVFRNHRAAA